MVSDYLTLLFPACVVGSVNEDNVYKCTPQTRGKTCTKSINNVYIVQRLILVHPAAPAPEQRFFDEHTEKGLVSLFDFFFYILNNAMQGVMTGDGIVPP